MRRNIKIFRYDPAGSDDGHFDAFTLDIPDETATTILDVLLRVQEEQDPTLAFRFACRVNMCGSCGMVINGEEALACKKNVAEIPAGREITVRPLNHFPVIKDLVVDMTPFFEKYESILPFFEPKDAYSEPALISPDSQERLDIGSATECIACGCCVSSCTMAYDHEGYAGPAALNRAFTLLADSRDALYAERLDRALASCYNCRTEFNCTEVCPKGISPTKAIKHIQRLALTTPRSQELVSIAPAPPVSTQSWREAIDRRSWITGSLGAAAAAVLGAIGIGAFAGPASSRAKPRWIPVAALAALREGNVTTVPVRYEVQSGPYVEHVAAPVMVSRVGDEIVCFNASCPHLGCTVSWDASSSRFRCACHGGTFDRDGAVVAGPPPRGLDRYRFKIDSGRLWVEVA
jgi:succinate dehydrogenase / fumarate reductase iron-sulfur subunit